MIPPKRGSPDRGGGGGWTLRAGAPLLAAALVAGVGVADVRSPGAAASDRGWEPDPAGAAQEDDGPAYDGRFTFLRLRYETGRGRFGRRFGSFRGGQRCASFPDWAHDMPCAEINFTKILKEVTFIDARTTGGRVLTLDDPDLFRYPVAYIIEVQSWRPGEEEVRALGEYLSKGGFLIVDDFRGRYALNNFVRQMQRALPGLEPAIVPDDHPVFNSFFRIENPTEILPPPSIYGRGYVPVYLGYFEDNDPSKRLMVILNYNNDHSEYWEYSDRGYYPIDLSNEAYKFGVNYITYAMTH